MKTKNQLAVAVLQDIRVLAANESPTAADAALVEGAYDTKLAEWRRRGFVWWTNTNRSTQEIPDEVFPALVDLISNEVAGAFASAGAPRNAVEKRAIEAELLRSLRALNHKPPSGEPTSFSSY